MRRVYNLLSSRVTVDLSRSCRGLFGEMKKAASQLVFSFSI